MLDLKVVFFQKCIKLTIILETLFRKQRRVSSIGQIEDNNPPIRFEIFRKSTQNLSKIHVIQRVRNNDRIHYQWLSRKPTMIHCDHPPMPRFAENYLLVLCLVHSALHLKRTGLLGHTQGRFYQIGCDRESVGLGNCLLEFACITPIGGVV
jgi:hypothetical protein